MIITTQSKLNTIKRCKPLLGTFVEITLSAKEEDAKLFALSQKAFAEIEAVERSMSFFDSHSELSKLNRKAFQETCSISQDMHKVLSTALQISSLTNGLYDISIAPQLVEQGLLPENSIAIDAQASSEDIVLTENTVAFNKRMLIDLGGIAKGYAVDQAYLAVCDQVDDVVINAGGDLRRKKWQENKVGVKVSNKRGEQYLFDVPMHNMALATSASYYLEKEKSAIISPLSRMPINDKRSFSVFADNCMVADALTKVAFLCDGDYSALDFLNAKALTLNDNGDVTFIN